MQGSLEQLLASGTAWEPLWAELKPSAAKLRLISGPPPDDDEEDEDNPFITLISLEPSVVVVTDSKSDTADPQQKKKKKRAQAKALSVGDRPFCFEVTLANSDGTSTGQPLTFSVSSSEARSQWLRALAKSSVRVEDSTESAEVTGSSGHNSARLHGRSKSSRSLVHTGGEKASLGAGTDKEQSGSMASHEVVHSSAGIAGAGVAKPEKAVVEKADVQLPTPKTVLDDSVLPRPKVSASASLAGITFSPPGAVPKRGPPRRLGEMRLQTAHVPAGAFVGFASSPNLIAELRTRQGSSGQLSFSGSPKQAGNASNNFAPKSRTNNQPKPGTSVARAIGSPEPKRGSGAATKPAITSAPVPTVSTAAAKATSTDSDRSPKERESKKHGHKSSSRPEGSDLVHAESGLLDEHADDLSRHRHESSLRREDGGTEPMVGDGKDSVVSRGSRSSSKSVGSRKSGGDDSSGNRTSESENVGDGKGAVTSRGSQSSSKSAGLRKSGSDYSDNVGDGKGRITSRGSRSSSKSAGSRKSGGDNSNGRHTSESENVGDGKGTVASRGSRSSSKSAGLRKSEDDLNKNLGDGKGSMASRGSRSSSKSAGSRKSGRDNIGNVGDGKGSVASRGSRSSGKSVGSQKTGSENSNGSRTSESETDSRGTSSPVVQDRKVKSLGRKQNFFVPQVKSQSVSAASSSSSKKVRGSVQEAFDGEISSDSGNDEEADGVREIVVRFATTIEGVKLSTKRLPADTLVIKLRRHAFKKLEQVSPGASKGCMLLVKTKTRSSGPDMVPMEDDNEARAYLKVSPKKKELQVFVVHKTAETT